jgi:hypothetical protein
VEITGMNLGRIARVDKRERGPLERGLVIYGLVLVVAAACLAVVFTFLGVQVVNLLLMIASAFGGQ